MRPKQYRTIWISVDDWGYLLRVSAACGLSASLLTAQSVEVLVRVLRAAGVDDLMKKASHGVFEAQALREKVAQVLQSLVVEN